MAAERAPFFPAADKPRRLAVRLPLRPACVAYRLRVIAHGVSSMPLLLTPTRRGFLAGMASLLAAPAIVRASSLMQIVVPTQWIEPGLYSLEFDTGLARVSGAFLTAFDPNGNHEMLITERMKLPTRSAALDGTKMPAVCALDTDAPVIRDFLGAEMRLPALPLARPVPPDSMNTTHIERGDSRFGDS